MFDLSPLLSQIVSQDTIIPIGEPQETGNACKQWRNPGPSPFLPPPFLFLFSAFIHHHICFSTLRFLVFICLTTPSADTNHRLAEELFFKTLWRGTERPPNSLVVENLAVVTTQSSVLRVWHPLLSLSPCFLNPFTFLNSSFIHFSLSHFFISALLRLLRPPTAAPACENV